MALPVIKIDSASGSDTQASGAGPDTALFGSSGVSAGDGLSVDLTTDNPDLSGVAQDGSAVLFFNDSTAGNRNFSKITSISGKVVTVANAFGASLTRGWAIGGKRSAIGTTLSSKLFSNNGAAGDAMPGWIVEFQSGHTETIGANLTLRRAGDATDGYIILQGAAGAATLPCVTFSNNGYGFTVGAAYIRVRDFELRNSNASKTGSVAIQVNSGTSPVAVSGIKVAHSTDKFWKGIIVALGNAQIRDCEVGYCASNGFDLVSAAPRAFNCYSHHNGGDGFAFGNASNTYRAIGNISYANTGHGISVPCNSTSANPGPMLYGNVCDSNGGDGLRISSTTAQLSGFWFLVALNNIFSNNGGYAVNFSAGSFTDMVLAANGVLFLNNDHYNNTSDSGHLTSLGAAYSGEENTANINPAFTDAAGGDFSSSALRELGYPLGGTLAVGKYSNTYSYPDIGIQAHVAPGVARAASRKRAFESKHVINY